jgi:hypothetical protein
VIKFFGLGQLLPGVLADCWNMGQLRKVTKSTEEGEVMDIISTFMDVLASMLF